MGFTSPSNMPHNQRHYSMTQPKPQQRQKECLLGEHRRRSNSSGEKSQHQVSPDTAASQLKNNQSFSSNERNSNVDHLTDSKNTTMSPFRFKFLPLLVNSHSSDNFNQLRRVALATVCSSFYFFPIHSIVIYCMVLKIIVDSILLFFNCNAGGKTTPLSSS